LEKYWKDFGFEPLSQAGKRIVTTHNDIHRGNVLIDKNQKAYLIDYETTSVTWAISDICQVFERKLFGTENYEGKVNFCKIYLEELGLASTKEEIDLLIFDAEVNRTRRGMKGCIMLDDIIKTEKQPKYNYKLYKQYEKLELVARTNEDFMQKIIKEGF